MNSDNVGYALSVLPFLPYSKAVAKSVLSHSASLSLGLLAFIASKHRKGDPTMRTPDVNDYMIAYPLAVPLWVAGFVYLLFNLAADGLLNPLLVMLLFVFWLRLYQHSFTVLCEHSSRVTTTNEEKEALPCPQLVKI